MNVKRIVFLGNSHIKGVGSEWPTAYGDLIATPPTFKQNIWTNYIRTTDDTPNEIKAKYEEQVSKLKFNPKKIQKYRDESCFPSLICKHYGKECINLGIESYNFYQIYADLLIKNPTFEDSLVILGIPKLTNDILYHNPIGTQKFENVTVPYAASTLVGIKEFVEARGGKFVYFHVEDYPEEFYNLKHNPFMYHLTDRRLFDFALYDIASGNSVKKKHDGIHFDMSGHKLIARKFIEQFENTLIFSILMS